MDSVFIVEKITDYEYGCRSVEAVFSDISNAEKYIASTGDQCEVIFWDGSKSMKYKIEEYDVLQ